MLNELFARFDKLAEVGCNVNIHLCMYVRETILSSWSYICCLSLEISPVKDQDPGGLLLLY